MTNVAKLKAQMGAFFAVEVHGEEATVEHAENVVYVSDDGNVVDLDQMMLILLDVARTEDGWEGLSDEAAATRLLKRIGQTEAES